MHYRLLRLPYHLFLAFALTFALGACDSNDPVDDPIDNPDGDNDNDDDNSYACVVPELSGVEVGQASVTFDYADFNTQEDVTGAYVGGAAYGSVEDFGDLYSVIYLPDGDGATRNVTFYDETDAALAPGEYAIQFTGAEDFIGYFFTDEGDFSSRSGGDGTLEITSVEDGVASGTFEFGDSVSAFCGAFKAELDEDLAPEGFDPN